VFVISQHRHALFLVQKILSLPDDVDFCAVLVSHPVVVSDWFGRQSLIESIVSLLTFHLDESVTSLHATTATKIMQDCLSTIAIFCSVCDWAAEFFVMNLDGLKSVTYVEAIVACHHDVVVTF